MGEDLQYVPVNGAELFVRQVGNGRPLLVVHGGPDFDHTYLLPDMDRLADGYRLVYYDQRGRGRSRGDVRLEDIGIDLYVEDLDAIRRHVTGGAVAILGHSWGGLLAMHYAIAHPQRVSHLVLLNTAPASSGDMMLVGQERARRRARIPGFAELAASDAFADGDPHAVAEFYRRDFGTTFKEPADAARLKLEWTREDIVRGRAIEERLMSRLYDWQPFTLLPALPAIRCPTLVIHGALDFIPVACDERIRDAIARANLVMLADSGHFSYIDAPDQLRGAVDAFFATDS